ncbi:MAG TPA: LPS-assembly protein LptD, partial [Thioalkalivibrio sp.]|nr:LPS-assembly protein LptD [Thioalkalivibrio sp.]
MLAVAPEVIAQASPSAAEIDWRPKSELPDEVRRSLPEFCEGGYLPSVVPADRDDPALSNGGEAPLQASGLEARYEVDNELFLRGDVRLRQAGFRVTGSEARYDQGSGAVAIEGPLTSRGEGFLLTGDRADYDVN